MEYVLYDISNYRKNKNFVYQIYKKIKKLKNI